MGRVAGMTESARDFLTMLAMERKVSAARRKTRTKCLAYYLAYYLAVERKEN